MRRVKCLFGVLTVGILLLLPMLSFSQVPDQWSLCHWWKVPSLVGFDFHLAATSNRVFAFRSPAGNGPAHIFNHDGVLIATVSVTRVGFIALKNGNLVGRDATSIGIYDQNLTLLTNIHLVGVSNISDLDTDGERIVAASASDLWIINLSGSIQTNWSYPVDPNPGAVHGNVLVAADRAGPIYVYDEAFWMVYKFSASGALMSVDSQSWPNFTDMGFLRDGRPYASQGGLQRYSYGEFGAILGAGVMLVPIDCSLVDFASLGLAPDNSVFVRSGNVPDGIVYHFKPTYSWVTLNHSNDFTSIYVSPPNQRQSSSIIDFHYTLYSGVKTACHVAALGFFDGIESFSNVFQLVDLVEGTETNLNRPVPVDSDLNIAWDASTELSGQLRPVSIHVMADNGQPIVPHRALKIPSNGPNPELTIVDGVNGILNAYFWLFATNDPAIQLQSGRVYGVGGPYDGQLLVHGSSVTTIGTNFVLGRSGLRGPTSNEVQILQSYPYGWGNELIKTN